MSLRIKFFGAVDTVTGSCSLVHFKRSNKYFLIDCGMYQGSPDLEERNQADFQFDPAGIDAVFLTHAHLDHCGLLPRLVAQGFTGPIYCTQATADLTYNSLLDASRIGGSFSEKEVRAVKKLYRIVDEEADFRWGHYRRLNQDLLYSFVRTSHVLGSVAVELRFIVSPDKMINVVFTGDIGPCVDQKVRGSLIKQRQYPNALVDCVICESTYGDRERDPSSGDFNRRVAALSAALTAAFANKRKPVVIIPAFAMHRTQEFLADLHHVFTQLCPQGNAIPKVIVDSKMARYQTQIYLRELQRRTGNGKWQWLNGDNPLFAGLDEEGIKSLLGSLYSASEDGECSLGLEGARWELTCNAEVRIDGHEPIIFLSASGTGLGGPVVRHLQDHLRNPDATVLLIGYQPPGSPGDRLKTLKTQPLKAWQSDVIEVGDKAIPGRAVQASVTDLSQYYSGHADVTGLVDFVLRDEKGKSTSPVTVLLNHGSAVARSKLKARLESTAAENRPGYRQLNKVLTPNPDDGWFDLIQNQWASADIGAVSTEEFREIKEKLEEILQNQRQILQLLGSERNAPPRA